VQFKRGPLLFLARLLLNYPAQSSRRDTERSGYPSLVKNMTLQGRNKLYGLASFAVLSANPCCAAAK
jgi:hypothetical protein